MSGLRELSLAQMRAGLAKKEFSATELVQDALTAMDAAKGLNAFVLHTPEHALAKAAEADANIKAGKARALEGIPVGVKDLFCTNGFRSQSCSKILSGFKPPYESTVSAKLFASGAIMVGKTNMDEFAMGSANITSADGNVISPWKRKGSDAQLVPGGSSGGSSAAVAARLVPMALGTDTGGSIRQPAAFTGTAGIKPSYGRCSRYGMIAFASSLDQAGPIARTVEDCALTLEAIAGFDVKDSTSLNAPVPGWASAINPGLKGRRIGIPKEYRPEGLSAELSALWDRGVEWLKAAGAEIVPVSLPHTQYALATYYILAPAEASSNLARYDGLRYGMRVTEGVKSLDDMYALSRGAGFGKEVKRRILMGTYVLSAGYYDAYYKKAQRVRALIAKDFADAFTKVDALLTPTAPTAAFAIGEKMEDPLTMYLNDVFTVPASLAGVPALSVPAGLSAEGLPLGLQVIGKLYDEQTVFDVSRAIELAANFTARP